MAQLTLAQTDESECLPFLLFFPVPWPSGLPSVDNYLVTRSLTSYLQSFPFKTSLYPLTLSLTLSTFTTTLLGS